MATDKSLSTEQEKKILEKTPTKYVRFRPGSNGMQFPYVENGYAIHRLNEVFNYLWDFEIVGEQVGKKQIWVKGKLTVHLTPDLVISKSNFGGADIKFFQGTENPVDIGNDMKAASADALKKCASMFGLFEDIYWKDSEVGKDAKPGQNPSEPF
jgi:hypothetical protein